MWVACALRDLRQRSLDAATYREPNVAHRFMQTGKRSAWSRWVEAHVGAAGQPAERIRKRVKLPIWPGLKTHSSRPHLPLASARTGGT